MEVWAPCLLWELRQPLKRRGLLGDPCSLASRWLLAVEGLRQFMGPRVSPHEGEGHLASPLLCDPSLSHCGVIYQEVLIRAVALKLLDCEHKPPSRIKLPSSGITL